MSDADPRASGPARPARGRNGAVASPHHLATQAGLAALRAGGTAVDAAVATNAVLAVVAGYSCGLGGDAFWLIWDAEREQVVTLNGSGRAGSAATIDALRSEGYETSPEGGRWTVTVPGAVHSWGAAHVRFGHLPWADLLAPAVDLADAFPASPEWLAAVERSAVRFGTDGDWARTYRPQDRAREPGQIVRLPALARTLRRLADEGPAAAYTGTLARAASAYFASRGVPIDTADLASHSSDWGQPISVGYRGFTAMSHPPNSVGVAALQTLGMLERQVPPSPGAFDGRGWADTAWVHVGLEASRIALAERDGSVTDAEHMPEGAIEQLLSSSHLDRLAARIDPRRPMPLPASSGPAGGGTVFLATADRRGSIVSLIESNYRGFGSGLVDPATGIAYHDRGAFFSLEPRHPNALAPGKRTAHTLAPGMLLRDGRPWIAHGSMGGEIQPQVFAQFVSAVVDGRSDIATAVAAPRWAAMMQQQQGPASLTLLEARYRSAVADALAAMGHAVEIGEAFDPLLGHAQALEVVPDEHWQGSSYAAASDPRTEGSAAAY